MHIFESIFLGIVQGLTEFLPVSSSGHLVIFQYYLGVTDVPIFFDLFLHFATLLAVLFFFYARIRTLSKQMLALLATSTLPVFAVGFFARTVVEQMFSSLPLVVVTLFITGLLNITIAGIVRRRSALRSQTEVTTEPLPSSLTHMKAFIIGAFQAVALLPGISRSGSTVFAGLFLNLSRKEAFEFSFIMSIPVILIGSLVQLFEYVSLHPVEKIPLVTLLAGGTAAFITGLMSLRLFRYVIEKARLEWFGWYCVVLALGIFILEYLPTF